MNKNNRKIVNIDEYLLKYGPNKKNVKDKNVDNFNAENIYYDNFHEEPLDNEIKAELRIEVPYKTIALHYCYVLFLA